MCLSVRIIVGVIFPIAIKCIKIIYCTVFFQGRSFLKDLLKKVLVSFIEHFKNRGLI